MVHSSTTFPLYMLLSEPETISTYELIHQLELNGTSTLEVIRAVLRSRYYYDFASSLQGREAEIFIDVLDRALKTVTADTDIFQELRRICGRTGVLPSSHIIKEKLVKWNEHPIASGGFGDVWEGSYDNKLVAIKTLRGYHSSEFNKSKKFCKEVVLWKRLDHPNVVRFLGVSASVHSMCMISEFQTNGNVRRYVRSYPETNRFKLLLEIVEGLNYLHSCKIVHGDMKGDNILVSDDGSAQLCDFGLTSISSTSNGMTSASKFRGSIRWMAPELFDFDNSGPESQPTYSGDIYAVSMVVIELFTGGFPFAPIRNETGIMMKILNGIRPAKPERAVELGLSPAVWDLTQKCWDADPLERPVASELLEDLRQANPGASSWSRITKLDPRSREAARLLRFLLDSGDDFHSQLSDEDVRKLINIVDMATNSPYDADGCLSRSCLRFMRAVCSRTGLYPTSFTLLERDLTLGESLELTKLAEVRLGMHGKVSVVIKTLRPPPSHTAFKNKLYSEAICWRRLSHTNIINFLGLSTLCDRLCVVSERTEAGSVTDFLKLNPVSNRSNLLVDVAKGLRYLHSHDIVHGDLKATNVLINGAGVACLTGFGLASVVTKATDTDLPDISAYFSTRWMAPELLTQKQSSAGSENVTKMSDIYAFSMVALEIYTGDEPFQDFRKKVVVDKVLKGERPKRPDGFSDSLWELVEMCWRQDRDRRPKISFTLGYLLKVVTKTITESPPAVDDSEKARGETAPLLRSKEPKRSHVRNNTVSGVVTLGPVIPQKTIKSKPSFHGLMGSIGKPKKQKATNMSTEAHDSG